MLSSTVLIGHILWLKHDSATIQGFSEEKEAIYTHPILLLTEKDSNGYVKALSLTSFGGKSLMDYYHAEPEQRAKYLPIHPSEAHPDNGKLLTLANNSRLPKESCVNIVDIRTLPHDHIEPFYRDNQIVEFRLSNTSMRRVHELTNTRPATLARSAITTPSTNIREERKQRELVDAEAGMFNWFEWGVAFETDKRAIQAVWSPNIYASLPVERGADEGLEVLATGNIEPSPDDDAKTSGAQLVEKGDEEEEDAPAHINKEAKRKQEDTFGAQPVENGDEEKVDTSADTNKETEWKQDETSGAQPVENGTEENDDAPAHASEETEWKQAEAAKEDQPAQEAAPSINACPMPGAPASDTGSIHSSPASRTPSPAGEEHLSHGATVNNYAAVPELAATEGAAAGSLWTWLVAAFSSIWRW